MYLSKMKKDWAKIDSDTSGKGMKKAQRDYVNQNILKWEKEAIKRKKYLEKHPECDDSIDDGLCESYKEVYKDKVKRRFRKKRKKKYRRLWGNCIPLSNYKGRLSVNQELVQERRRIRYKEGNQLQISFTLVERRKKKFCRLFSRINL
jgi:hypothetical protein